MNTGSPPTHILISYVSVPSLVPTMGLLYLGYHLHLIPFCFWCVTGVVEGLRGCSAGRGWEQVVNLNPHHSCALLP